MVYDVAIIGAGIGGLMTAYQLKKNNPNLSIIIFDKGKEINERICPAAENKDSCYHCGICDITNGFGGSGSFSDAKYNIGTAYGGTLADEIGPEKTMHYIKSVDDILKSHSDGDYPDIYKSDNSLKIKCVRSNLQLLDMDVRHLGTDRNQKIMNNFISKTLHNVIKVNYAEITDIVQDYNGYCIYKKHPNSNHDNFKCEYHANTVVIATGRSGSSFVKSVCSKFKVNTNSNTVDLGVRVEMDDNIWKEFSSKIYEPKILYRTKTFEDKTRMFCFNQGGIVSAENNDGIITANGHSYSDLSKKTTNCNFAILSSINFTQPFNQPTEYVKNISKLANDIGDGNVLVQRFGDLIRGRRTNYHRLSQNSVNPTLSATPGDLSLVLPHRILINIIETLYALNNVAPGTSNDDTLLYGVEAKYYSLKPAHNDNFEIRNNMYLIGDGSGITRGLSQAGAMGLYVADKIYSRMCE